MGHMMKEDEDGVLYKHQSGSQLIEDDYIESANGGIALKKGPWTAAEDAILVEYVKHHGEGNWNAVQKHSGLSRCGKSCRLRWANHLRPNLKKGAFTPEEEQLIIELHAKMGNKWARMAAHLPGRTDNEIKNYWNTRVKRRERAGLPLYPPEVSLQTFQETQEGLDVCGANGDRGFRDLVYGNNYETPGFLFESFGASHHHLFGHEPELPDLPPIMMHRQKRLRESTNILCSFDGSERKEFSYLHQFEDEPKDYLSQSFDLGFPFDPDLTSKNLPSLVESQEFPVFSECSFSAFMPTSRTGKLELPSLQYPETLFDSPEISSGPAVKKSDGTLMHSPLAEMVESDCTTPRNSGLLDALLYEAKSLCNGKNNSSDRSSKSSTELEEYSDSLSPLGHTASSVSNCTPARANGSFSNEDPPGVTFTGYVVGYHVKQEQVDQASTTAEATEVDAALEFFQPDGFPVQNWLQPSSDFSKDQNVMIDAIGVLLGDDLSNEYKQMASGATTVFSHQGRGIEFFAWNNNLPDAVCQTSEPTP